MTWEVVCEVAETQTMLRRGRAVEAREARMIGWEGWARASARGREAPRARDQRRGPTQSTAAQANIVERRRDGGLEEGLAEDSRVAGCSAASQT